MSAAQSPTTLDALQCHFTWDIHSSGTKLYRLRDKLEDIGTEEGNSWLGHIYNLRGFIQYELGFTEDAHSLFNKAAEAFLQAREPHTDKGPWLVVNYGNLAWLHHHLNNQAKSQDYLSKVEALMKKQPPPSQDELHPEVYAEKAWTLMNFGADKQLLAADCFERAIRMKPDRVEWNSSYVIGLVKASVNCHKQVDADMLEKMRTAKEQDPDNLYLAVHYLDQCSEKEKEKKKDEARELARKVLRNPVSSYSGLKALLWVYSQYIPDEAINLAEEAVRNHPDVRYLKNCLALCYKWIIFSKGTLPNQSMIDEAISLHEEVISLYQDSSLVKKIDLADINAKSIHSHAKAQAEQIYQKLLESDLEPADKQLLYHKYANYLYFNQQDANESIKCHMKAAEIPDQSFFREQSITVLKEIREKRRNRMCGEIEEFLANLQEP